MRPCALAIAVLVTAGCTSAPRDLTPALQGVWGGRHIGLTVGTMDSDVQFDCAEGTIIGPYAVEADGRFSWAGTYTRGTGGPVRIDQQPASKPATYVGTTRGGSMTLSVDLGDGQRIGPFALERFREPNLTRCL